MLENISKHQLADHLADVLSTVQAALTDSDARVREAAGEAFAILFKGGAGSAVESVVPSMIQGEELGGGGWEEVGLAAESVVPSMIQGEKLGSGGWEAGG